MFDNGKKQGLFLAYHRNGKLSMKGNYKADKRNGKWEFHRESGAFGRVEIFEDK